MERERLNQPLIWTFYINLFPEDVYLCGAP